MGSWGVDTFENDTACDWTYELENIEDLSLVSEVFAQVAEMGDDELDSSLACEALAACEVIARLKGNWGSQSPFTEAIDRWVQSHQTLTPGALVDEAARVIQRVLSPPSELAELWEESGQGEEWRNSVQQLKARVLK